MEARLLALALAALLIGGLFLWLRRELLLLDASTLARRLAVGAYGLCALGWLSVYGLGAPFWLGWITSLPAVAMTLVPARYADVVDELETGASPPEAVPSLAGEIEAIGHALTDRRAQATTRAELETRVEGLDRWRTPAGDQAVDELVHLFQGWALDRLDGRPRDVLLEADREERIADLLAVVEGSRARAGAPRPTWARLGSRLRRMAVPVGRQSGAGLRSPLDASGRGERPSEGPTRGR
jgi:hypothetical protein